MTADDNLNQRVQISKDRFVKTTPPEARTGEGDPVLEPERKVIRFAEGVKEQTPEGLVGTSSRSTSSSSSSSSISQTAIAPSMQLDETNEDHSKTQKVTRGADTELQKLVVISERDRLQRSLTDFLMQVKQNADVYIDRFFSNDRRKRAIVKKELIQLRVHPSVHVAEVFSSPRRTARFVHRFGLTAGIAFDLRTGWELHDSAQRAKKCGHICNTKGQF